MLFCACGRRPVVAVRSDRLLSNRYVLQIGQYRRCGPAPAWGDKGSTVAGYWPAMYAPDRWHEFYVMVGGASAALTGLIFVAISIHLRSVLATRFYRARARYLTGGLMLALVTSALVLVPGQSRQVLGAELLGVGLITALAFAVPVARLARIAGPRELDVRVRQAVAWVALALWVVSGMSLIVGRGGGLYILLVGVVIVLNICVGGAWSLLTGSEARAELQDAARAPHEALTGPDTSGVDAAKRKSPTGRSGA